jgi:hypothetical protein
LFQQALQLCLTHGLGSTAGEQKIADGIGAVNQPIDQRSVCIEVKLNHFWFKTAGGCKTNGWTFARQV